MVVLAETVPLSGTRMDKPKILCVEGESGDIYHSVTVEDRINGGKTQKILQEERPVDLAHGE